MATWGLHMRMAEIILEEKYNLDTEYFLVGNIGADCGVPNENWTQFTPHTDISHWSTGGKSGIQEDRFREINLNDPSMAIKKKSFLLGYYVHLLTDKIFTHLVKDKVKNDRNYAPYLENPDFLWTIKKDWYDLDHKYFRDHPDNIFHKAFQHVRDFPDYMDYYPKGAVQRQVDYITQYYLKPTDDLDREYLYLNEEETEKFLEYASKLIVEDMDTHLAEYLI